MKNNKRLKRIIVILIILAFFIPMLLTPMLSFGEEVDVETKLNNEMEYLKYIIEFVQSKYVGEKTTDELIEGAVKGIFDTLDKNSSYYDPEEYEEFFGHISGDFSGIGVYIVEEDGYVTVLSPIQGTPADKAGLLAGDKIVSVDGVDIKGYTTEEAANIIKGETGTQVKIGILREGEKDILYFDITRDVIKINPVSYEILEDDIGYIRISQFNSHTLENIETALAEMDSKNIEKLVIDLRNNPGGLLDEVVAILNYFIPEGPIVHEKRNNDQIITHSSSLKETKYELAVLVNEGSASASEIFAGAVQDTEVGTIIGTTTYGKGTVQTIYGMNHFGKSEGLKITTAEYFTANMRSINGIGVEPDIVVENTPPTFDIDLADIPNFRMKDKLTLNTVGLDVLAAEQILSILGYEVTEPDGVLDEITFEAIKKFQLDKGLWSYGTLDYTTQETLDEALSSYIAESIQDLQLQKAIEVLSEKDEN